MASVAHIDFAGSLSGSRLCDLPYRQRRDDGVFEYRVIHGEAVLFQVAHRSRGPASIRALRRRPAVMDDTHQTRASHLRLIRPPLDRPLIREETMPHIHIAG